MKKLTVKCPATIANIVCGFDVLGMCLNDPFDTMDVFLLDEKKIIIKSADGYPLPEDPLLNTAGAPLVEMLNELGTNSGFEILIHKHIKPGSGLGSSAASAAGAVVAANELLNNPFSKQDLVRFAMFGEKVASGVKHADNVAPCIYGGITLIRSVHPLDIISLNTPRLFVTVVHPQIEVKTSDARQILRKEVQLKDAIRQWGNIAALVAGFMKNDYDLIGRSLEDYIIEPVRSMLIPGFEEVKKRCKKAGALGGGISGSGPSIFMLNQDETIASETEEIMQDVFSTLGIDYKTYVTSVNTEGVQVVKRE